MGPARATLADGRLHFQHGPIDLIIGADGRADALAQAVEAAWARFQDVLPELVEELRQLRRAMSDAPQVTGPVARRMVTAAGCFPEVFLTPMAAVAGAVADEMIQCFRVQGVERAYVNNGGDIALHLTPATRYEVGIASALGAYGSQRAPTPVALEIGAEEGIRGIATSGWRGRSFSLGIADGVTVGAGNAALADAAATLVANAVNIDSPAVARAPANSLKDDTDLGGRLITVSVGPLRDEEVAAALDNGVRAARGWCARGLIRFAVLVLQGQGRTVRAAVSSGGAGEALPGV